MDLSLSSHLKEIGAQTGVAFRLQAGEVLHVVAIAPEQVADLALFDGRDTRDAFSPGRTIDYNERISLEIGDTLYSQRSIPLAEVLDDTAGVHDILLAPCSRAMFERRGELDHRSCQENLATNLASFGVLSDDVVATVNVFMDVRIDAWGRVTIHAPKSRIGDRFSVRAVRDIVVGLTACSSELTNNGACKPVAYAIDNQPLTPVVQPLEG